MSPRVLCAQRWVKDYNLLHTDTQTHIQQISETEFHTITWKKINETRFYMTHMHRRVGQAGELHSPTNHIQQKQKKQNSHTNVKYIHMACKAHTLPHSIPTHKRVWLWFFYRCCPPTEQINSLLPRLSSAQTKKRIHLKSSQSEGQRAGEARV